MQVYHCLFGWVEETPAFRRCAQCDRRRCFESPPSEEEHQLLIRTKATIATRDYEPFRSPIDDTIIRNRREKMDHCRKHDVIEYEPSLIKKGKKDA